MEEGTHEHLKASEEVKIRQAIVPSLWQVGEHALTCRVCSRHCKLREGATGFCTAIINDQGRLYSTAYGVIGEASATPIENRPVYHYRPGSRVLTLGGIGCNLRCGFCQNWEVAFRDASNGANLTSPNLSPQRAIELALEQDCQGIGWSFNEPSISPMYTLDCARLARAAGLYTVFVTNGLMTHQALDLLGPYIDVYRVDIKSVDKAFYKYVAGTTQINELFPIARRAQQEFHIHVETVTNIMPGLNDRVEPLTRLTEQIVTYLGEDTPWHITTYIPYAYMTHIPPTPSKTLQQARAIGLRAGLRFVYTDDSSTPETSHTFCPRCHMLAIERIAHHIKIHALDADGKCSHCGMALAVFV